MKTINTDKMIMCKKSLLSGIACIVVLIVIFTQLSNAQQQNLPLGNYYRQQIDFEMNKLNKAVHTSFKPLLKSKISYYTYIDSVIYNYKRKDKFYEKHPENIIWRKLFFEDFIAVEKDNFSLYANPLFYMEKGYTEDEKNLFINTRGIELKGNIGKNISFYSSFRENQARYRSYIYDWSWERLVVPGQGAFKKNNNDLTLLDFSMASAYLSYSPKDWLNIQIGQDKHFIGEGHRSLFLSDNAFNYPFIKISANNKHFKYTTLFTEFRDFENSYYDYHTKKHGALNYLSYCFQNIFEIGLFEGIIYRTTDTAEYVNKFKADFFIPVIGVRTAINGFAAEHNVITGINAKIRITDHIQIYGQSALDDPKQKKIAYQGGLKIFDLFHSKLKGQRLYLQAELNYARPRTYSHHYLKFQTWSHYNQELAHPAGSDFNEYFVNLQYSLLNFSLNYYYINMTLNNKRTFSNIYVTDQIILLSPNPGKIIHHTVNLEYTINPGTGLQIYLGADYRTSYINDQVSERYIMFGIRTRISNYPYDF